jgi:hypothetical protein
MIEEKKFELEPPEQPYEQPITVDKITCARTQIETAIRLYFQDGDPVSIHTLAFAAYDLLKGINKDKDGKPLTLEFAGLASPEDSDLKRRVITAVNSARNFFKHADKDPQETKVFRPRVNEYVIFECVEVYGRFELITELMSIYYHWFLAMHFHWYLNHAQAPFKVGMLPNLKKILTRYDRSSKTAYFEKMLREKNP